MTIAHHDFTIARTYPYPPAQVFEAFADRATKALWFGSSETMTTEAGEFDFRAGGHETAATQHADGSHTTFDAHYADVVPNERIVFTYTMTLNATPLSLGLDLGG